MFRGKYCGPSSVYNLEVAPIPLSYIHTHCLMYSYTQRTIFCSLLSYIEVFCKETDTLQFPMLICSEHALVSMP